jgi:sialic acid synthase SpsE
VAAERLAIGSRLAGPGYPVFVIAEAGVNHNGDLGLALRMVETARAAGADAVKFQTFRAEALNTRAAPKATYHIETTGADATQSWFDLLRSQELTREMHEALIRRCRELDIVFLSTPYDEASADLLEELGVAAFKIASTDTNNIPLLRHIARKGRPVILSTAMSTLDEVRESVAAVRDEGLEALVVLHCTGNYPAALGDTNMRSMVTMRETLGVLVGYSDHTREDVNPVLATALGAVVYEKHFTLDRTLPGPDHRMSLTPADLTRTVELIRQAEAALGSGEKAVLASERENRVKLRKSLVAATDLPAGELLERWHIVAKRPGDGMAPSALDALIGKRLRVPVMRDQQLAPSMVK